ncbi:probable citrate synthase, mitochondrial [Ochotona princeps]|uniref:probable citrate synthase, mitochondrial n=1 Tax=Ochotona princeps TaxID=9978 RepID=UPI00271463D0|nr:probable citrate synthase, mitochondrial [Ochotona princeps]
MLVVVPGVPPPPLVYQYHYYYVHHHYYYCYVLIAKTAVLAARIYQRTFRSNNAVPVPQDDLDWGANFAAMLGLTSPEAHELIRLYLLLHADHEGGNVSAHAAHVVGSALSDVYLATTAGLAGLAGPLHGLANQECLKWLQNAAKDLGEKDPTPETVRHIAQKTLDSGQVIPGYGHAVLRVTDPRFLVQRRFALKHLKDDALFK